MVFDTKWRRTSLVLDTDYTAARIELLGVTLALRCSFGGMEGVDAAEGQGCIDRVTSLQPPFPQGEARGMGLTEGYLTARESRGHKTHVS